MPEQEQEGLLKLTSDIVAAHLSRTMVASSDLPALIKSVRDVLLGLQKKELAAPKPATPIEQSVTPEYIVCLEDGKRFKMLKRHLKVAFNMTPDEYRQKWNLPPDYPMTAPKYSALRRKIVKSFGLGQIRKNRRKTLPGFHETVPGRIKPPRD